MKGVWPSIKINSAANDMVATTVEIQELFDSINKSRDSKSKYQLYEDQLNALDNLRPRYELINEYVDSLLTERSFAEQTFADIFLSTSRMYIISKGDFVKRHQEEFTEMIKYCHLDEDGYDNLVLHFEKLLKEDELGAQTLIANMFSETLVSDVPDIDLQVRILKFLANLSYESLGASAALIMSSAYSLSDIRVKSAVCDLFGHWANRPSYNLLKQMNRPQEPWLKMKYDSLIVQLEQKYVISSEN